MAGTVSSEVFPNLKIDSSIKVPIDNVLRKLKESPDSDVKAFVGELKSLHYEIKNGSPEDRAMCVGSNNSDSKTMYIPEKLVGTYTGSDGKQHSATLERMLAHELAHALGVDRKETGMNKSVVPRLLELAMQDGEAIKGAGAKMTPAQIAGTHNKFPTGVAHEAGAVAVENFIARQVFHDYNARANVGDKNPSFTADDLRTWGKDKYPMTGNCRGVPLAREVETSLNDQTAGAQLSQKSQVAQAATDKALEKHPELSQDYLLAKQQLLTQLDGRPTTSQEMVIAQFNINAAKNIEKGVSPMAASTEKHPVIDAQLIA